MSQQISSSFHTHSEYCDGHGTVRQVVEAAIAANLTEVGISSHAPLPFEVTWAMSHDRLHDYVHDVREMQRDLGDRITIWRGLELDFVPDPRVQEFQDREILPLGFDYVIGSVHFLGDGYPPQSYEGNPDRFRAILRDDYGNDIKMMVAEYYRRIREMLKRPEITIVGHFDRVKRWNEDRAFFRDDEPWYRDAVEETVRAIGASGKLVELNTSGWRKGSNEPYPAPWILDRCREHGVPVIVTSDAHAPDQVTWGFERAERCVAELGIVPVRSISQNR